MIDRTLGLVEEDPDEPSHWCILFEPVVGGVTWRGWALTEEQHSSEDRSSEIRVLLVQTNHSHGCVTHTWWFWVAFYTNAGVELTLNFKQ